MTKKFQFDCVKAQFVASSGVLKKYGYMTLIVVNLLSFILIFFF